MFYDIAGNPIKIDHAGIAMMERESRERAQRKAQERRQREAKFHAEMFPPRKLTLNEAQTKAVAAATDEERIAYIGAVVAGDAAAALSAGAKFGFSAEYVAQELKSDWANAQREQIKAHAAAEQQARYEKLKAANTLTDAQARFAAGLELPKSKTGGAVPSEENMSLGQRLDRRGALTPGAAAFADSIELPPT